MKRLILFLIRRHMGLTKFEPFQFENQQSNAVYYFGDDAIKQAWRGNITKSTVSLNWLLDPDCKIRKLDDSNEDNQAFKDLAYMVQDQLMASKELED